jgi:REP element-mobilizing transposase RayT
MRLSPFEDEQDQAPTLQYFDPQAPVTYLTGTLPHWRQPGATYFVTFRLADSLPQEKLRIWIEEKAGWLAAHPEPRNEALRREYFERFPQRLQRWLDAGHGSCILSERGPREIVLGALRHFDGERYSLNEFVVAANHVHAVVSTRAEYDLSKILHSWKSFTAHEIRKLGDASHSLGRQVWQKESFDHIVRSDASLAKFQAYIRGHQEWAGMRTQEAETVSEG